MKKDSPLILVSCCYRLLCYVCFTHAKQTNIPVVSFASPSSPSSSWEGTHWSSTVFLVRGFPLLCFHFSFLWNRIEWSNKMRRRETIDLRSTLSLTHFDEEVRVCFIRESGYFGLWLLFSHVMQLLSLVRNTSEEYKWERRLHPKRHKSDQTWT